MGMPDRATLIEYLLMKAKQEDWHAVRDACVDIEILDAKISCRCRAVDLASLPTKPDTIRS